MWHYFEKGHGKGPCDGIGGAVKRGAAKAAKLGDPKADAHQFHDWAMQHESGISFVMISGSSAITPKLMSLLLKSVSSQCLTPCLYTVSVVGSGLVM